MTSITAAELARRARTRSLARISEADALEYLREWAARGIAFEASPGRWRLSHRGRAMFGGWALGLDLDDDEAAA